MRVYTGRVDKKNSAVVFVIDDHGDSSRLPLCLDMQNHSPTGFAWGYEGSGPSQLAFALVWDATRDEHLTRMTYQEFKRRKIATLSWQPRRSWKMTRDEVLNEVVKIVNERAAGKTTKGI